MPKTSFLTAAIAATLAAAAPAGAQDTPIDSLARARQYTAWLYAGQADSLLAHSTDETRAQFAEPPGYGRLSETIAHRAGFELAVLDETWKLRNGSCQYWRTARVSGMEEPLLVRWVLDPGGRIAGVGLGPLSQAPPVDRETCPPGSD